MKQTKLIFAGIIICWLTTFSFADEIYVEGTDANGYSIFGYVEIEGIYIDDSFVEDIDDNIIFLNNERYDVDEDFFDQTPDFEDDVDFFNQQFETNIDEE